MVQSLLKINARVIGTHGQMKVFNPISPQHRHRLSVRSTEGRRVEHLTRRSSYAFQLDAFTGAVLRGRPVLTGPTQAIANMTVIDAIYRAASMPLRQPSSTSEPS